MTKLLERKNENPCKSKMAANLCNVSAVIAGGYQGGGGRGGDRRANKFLQTVLSLILLQSS